MAELGASQPQLVFCIYYSIAAMFSNFTLKDLYCGVMMTLQENLEEIIFQLNMKCRANYLLCFVCKRERDGERGDFKTLQSKPKSNYWM